MKISSFALATPMSRGSRCVPPVRGDQTERHFRGAKLRRLAGDPEVAREGQLETTPDREPVDRGDHGNPKSGEAPVRGETLARQRRSLRNIDRGHFLHVGASAEILPLAGEHDGADLGVRSDLANAAVEVGEYGDAEGVHRGVIEDQDLDPVLLALATDLPTGGHRRPRATEAGGAT